MVPDALQVLGGLLILAAVLYWLLDSLRSPYDKDDFINSVERLHKQKQAELERIEKALEEYDDQG
jgi:sensor domain CHASE-containing protein